MYTPGCAGHQSQGEKTNRKLFRACLSSGLVRADAAGNKQPCNKGLIRCSPLEIYSGSAPSNDAVGDVPPKPVVSSGRVQLNRELAVTDHGWGRDLPSPEAKKSLKTG